MKTNIILVTLALLLSFSCSRERYLTSAYAELAHTHTTIAVLPSQTITTGRIPPEWTAEMIEEIEENESLAFQIAVFDEVAERSGFNEGTINIQLQHYTETNALLESAGISIRDSWKTSPKALAEALGVDAVVRTSVRKDMFLTELESFGLSMAQTAAAIFGGTGLPFFVPNKTSDVFLSAAIIDAKTASAVWNTDKVVQTDWNNRHSEIVRRLARVMARRFPYRV